jgi:hypothetical protein
VEPTARVGTTSLQRSVAAMKGAAASGLQGRSRSKRAATEVIAACASRAQSRESGELVALSKSSRKQTSCCLNLRFRWWRPAVCAAWRKIQRGREGEVRRTQLGVGCTSSAKEVWAVHGHAIDWRRDRAGRTCRTDEQGRGFSLMY